MIDDGSTDNSWDAIKSFGSAVIARRITNGGVSHARNVGLKNSKGDFIRFLDSDDLLCSNGLSKQLAFAEQIESDCIVVGKTAEFSAGGEHRGLDRYNLAGLSVGAAVGVLDVVSRVLSCLLCLYPRDLLIESGGFREDIRIGEDYELNSKFFRRGAKFIYSGIDVVKIRYHHNSRLSKSFQDRDHKILLSVMRECSDFISRNCDHLILDQAQFTLTKWAWSMGRSAARDKQYKSARAYFEFGKTMYAPHQLGGSNTANTLYRVIDPIASEKLLEIGKSIRNRMRRS